jgi:hypothetical protein
LSYLPVILVVLAFVALLLWLRRGAASQSTDDHETLARNPDTVFNPPPRPSFVVNGRAIDAETEEARARRQLNLTSAEPLPRVMVFSAEPLRAFTPQGAVVSGPRGPIAEISADVAEAAEHKLRVGDPTMRHLPLLTDGYDFRPARDCGPALHAEGL